MDLNLIRPYPKGPLGATKSRAAGFVAGRGFGLTKNKKASAGTRAGLGHAARKPRRIATVGTGVSVPAGPGPAAFGRRPDVRLPNRGTRPAATSAAKSKGFLGAFFKRFRKG